MLFPATVLLETDAYIRDFLVRSEPDGPDLDLRVPLPARPAICWSAIPAARSTRSSPRAAQCRRADLHLVARRQLDRHEHRVPRADERQHADDRSRTATSTRSARSSSPGKQNGCVILGGGSPKNFYLQGQPTLWEVYGIPKGGNDYFIQITTDQVVWGGLSGATPGRSGQLGQGQPRRAARHRRRLLRFDDRLSALLRVRRRLRAQPPAAQASLSTSATRWSPTCVRQAKAAQATRRRRSETGDRRERAAPRSIVIADGHALVGAGADRRAASASQPRVYADANMPNGVVGFMREHARVGRALRARARRPAARPRHRALSASRGSSDARWSRSIATTSTIAVSRRTKAPA